MKKMAMTDDAPKIRLGKKNKITAEDIELVRDAWAQADDFLDIAITRFLTADKKAEAALRMLGLEVALLRHAAKIAICSKKYLGARADPDSFADMARDQYRNLDFPMPGARKDG